MISELREELMAEVDEEWAEEIRHLRMTQGQPDTARDPIALRALLRIGDRGEERANFGSRTSGGPGIAAGGGVLRIDRSANIGLIVKKGDKIVALDRLSEPVFEVFNVDDRSHLRLICELGDAV